MKTEKLLLLLTQWLTDDSRSVEKIFNVLMREQPIKTTNYIEEHLDYVPLEVLSDYRDEAYSAGYDAGYGDAETDYEDPDTRIREAEAKGYKAGFSDASAKIIRR